jgi:hypothetical protein
MSSNAGSAPRLWKPTAIALVSAADDANKQLLAAMNRQPPKPLPERPKPEPPKPRPICFAGNAGHRGVAYRSSLRAMLHGHNERAATGCD